MTLEPVANPGGRVKYTQEAEEAKASPGEWFKLMSKSTGDAAWSAVNQIRTGRRAAFRPAGSFDAVARGTDVLIKFIDSEPAP